MAEKYFIVTDFGSSSIKTFLINTKGKIKGFSKRDFYPTYSGCKVEYDSLKLLDLYRSTLKDIFSLVLPDNNIISYGVSCQRSSFLIWDRDSGKPLTPVISWQDGRADTLSKNISFPDNKIHYITGLYKTPYYSAFKIKYLLDSNNEIKRAVLNKKALIGPIASYILWHLSEMKLFIIDPTLAQRMLLFNIRSLKWDEELINFFGIPYFAIPNLIPSFPDNLQIKVFNAKLCVSAVIGDQQAATLPFINSNFAVVNYGTGAFLLVGTGKQICKVNGILNSIAFTTSKNSYYLLESTVNSCGTFLQWLLLKFNLKIRMEELDKYVKNSKNRIWILPAIGGIGSPYWDYKTATTFTGFTPSFNFNDLIKGSLEGIAFLVAEGFNGIKKYAKIESIIALGGLSNIDYLLSFQSSILGKKILKFEDSEISSSGLAALMALLKGYDTSKWDIFKIKKTYKPDISERKRKEMIGNWNYFLKSTRNLYKKLNKN